ncbi:MAG: hypothetical protein VX854_05930, partial [Candidatus Thermoplasmatota archaeon]|nr:hypothetical protein [Candidatus Thermoplasmatota archaeon]
LEGDIYTFSFSGQQSSDSPRIVGGPALTPDGNNWSYNIGESQSFQIKIGNSELSARVFSQSPNLRTASCTSSMNNKMIESTCVFSNGSIEMAYTLMIIDDEGSLIHIETGIAIEDSTVTIYSNASWTPDVGTRSYTVTVHDRNGIIIETSTKEYEIRDTEWNIGISQFEINGIGDDRKISLTTTRTNKSKIETVRCTVSYSSGEWKLTQDIDLGGLLNPTVEVLIPSSINDGDQITATIGCSSPWEVDSNPEDHERSLIVSSESGLDANTQTALTGTVAALAIILILWAVGFTNPEDKKIRNRKRDSGKSRKDSREKAPKLENHKQLDDEDDSIHLEEDEIDELNQENEIIEIIEEIDESMEEVEQVVEQDELSQRLEGVSDPFERKLIELEYRREKRASRRR